MIARLWARLTSFLAADFVPLPPPDVLPPRPPTDPEKCRRCQREPIYRGGLCKKCDDDDYVAIMCSGMFVG